jgi:phosphoglycerol transferase MdoB-like AlkP superfamily enzyme
MDLFRFNVPLLLIAPGISERFGSRRDVVGTQVDVVPTIMGRLGGEVRHQCWGRDLLSLAPDDPGFGIIKPSGSDQTVAMIRGERLLVQPKDQSARLYRYRLGANPQGERLDDDEAAAPMLRQLQAYLQTATGGLLANRTGDREREEPLADKALARTTENDDTPVTAPGVPRASEG